ncbi:MAG: hypothetical protein QF535_18775 [Anaerolineales bacterium]|nr:hypothetical protein [Anaerolineales bacterium]
MAWQLLAAALPAAAKLAGTYLQKPDKKDYQPQTDYMKKYLGYIKGRSAQREVMHMAMQPQLRAIGRQGREMQQQVGYTAERSGVAGSGIEAQMRLSAGQATQEAMTTATEKAVAAQAAETARLGEKAELVTAQIGAEEQRAEQAYDTAGRQWKRQMGAEALGLGASIAGAKITQAGQAKEAAMVATRSGYYGDEANVQRMIDEGWTPQMFQQETARMDKVMTSIMGNEDPETVMAAWKQMTGADIAIPDVDYTTMPPDEALEAKAKETAGMVIGEGVPDPVQYKDINTVKQAREADSKVTEPVEEAVADSKVTEPDEGREAAVTTVYKNKPYTITIYNKDKTKSKSKTIRFTGNKTTSGKYVFKSDDGKRLDLTLEELNDGLKKKGEKDVVGIRKKLVEGGHEIVDVTAQTGLSSVLAGGKAKIRMAEPLAKKFVEAKNILADMGIEIQVADSKVDYGVKKKQYEKWIAGGMKGAKVADPDRSFHTIGFAFDLAQNPEMKRPEVAEALKSVGLVPHDTEWWHWSLEKV